MMMITAVIAGRLLDDIELRRDINRILSNNVIDELDIVRVEYETVNLSSGTHGRVGICQAEEVLVRYRVVQVDYVFVLVFAWPSVRLLQVQSVEPEFQQHAFVA